MLTLDRALFPFCVLAAAVAMVEHPSAQKATAAPQLLRDINQVSTRNPDSQPALNHPHPLKGATRNVCT